MHDMFLLFLFEKLCPFCFDTPVGSLCVITRKLYRLDESPFHEFDDPVLCMSICILCGVTRVVCVLCVLCVLCASCFACVWRVILWRSGFFVLYMFFIASSMVI